MKEDVIFGKKVKKKLTKGVKKVIKSVGATLGSKGQNVLIDSVHPNAPSIVTKDGVTVIRSIKLNDKVQQLAVKIIKEASEKTVDECGDGTTTTAILASAIYLEGIKHLENGINPILMKRGIEKLKDKLIEKIDEIKIDLTTDEQIRNIATISANNDEEIGSLITQAIDKVGKNGEVIVESGKSVENQLETSDGYKIERGFVSHYFVTNKSKHICELNEPLVFVSNIEFKNADEVVPLLEIASTKNKPLLIISNSGSTEVLQTLILNHIKNVVQICVVESPSFGDRRNDILQDIAIVANAEFLDVNKGFIPTKINENQLGSINKAIISKYDTILINENIDKNRLKERDEYLKIMIEEADNTYDKEFFKERLAKLNSGLAIIRVGGNSVTEVEEKKDRIDDALGATKSAIRGGIVAGGGVSLLHSAELIDMKDLDIKNNDEMIGINVLLEAIKYPFKRLIENSGQSADYVLKILMENINEVEFGYNVLTNEFGNMYDFGVIDPAEVIKSALKNAVSAGTLLLTSNVILMQKSE